MEKVKVFAPGSVANVGPGFDILGFAVEGIGDVVEARKISEPEVKIKKITGDEEKLPREAERNTVSIAARGVLNLLKVKEGMEIKLDKGLPLGSGLGGSGVSAVAGAFAANVLFGDKLNKEELVEPCMKAEGFVSGYHADNIASSLVGGFVLIKGYDPLEVISLGTVNLFCILLIPELEISTRKAREILPEKVALEDSIYNSSQISSLIVGILNKDTELIGNSINDKIVEPCRASLIPNFYEVKKKALEKGALGCSISGAGPSIFALTDCERKAKDIGERMQEEFELKSKIHICNVDEKGVRVIK